LLKQADSRFRGSVGRIEINSPITRTTGVSFASGSRPMAIPGADHSELHASTSSASAEGVLSSLDDNKRVGDEDAWSTRVCAAPPVPLAATTGTTTGTTEVAPTACAASQPAPPRGGLSQHERKRSFHSKVSSKALLSAPRGLVVASSTPTITSDDTVLTEQQQMRAKIAETQLAWTANKKSSGRPRSASPASSFSDSSSTVAQPRSCHQHNLACLAEQLSNLRQAGHHDRRSAKYVAMRSDDRFSPVALLTKVRINQLVKHYRSIPDVPQFRRAVEALPSPPPAALRSATAAYANRLHQRVALQIGR